MLRVLVFLIVSATAHFLAARWIIAVSPRARVRKRLVFKTAAALSLVLASLRVVGFFFQGSILHDVLAVALVELAIVVLSLPWLGFFAIASRLTAHGVSLLKPARHDEEKEARVGRREAIELVAGASVAATTTIALGWGFVRGRHAFAIEEVAIKVRGWPRALDGYVIAQVSDIHVGAFVGERELDEGFALVRRVKPDLIVATGDLVDANAQAIGPFIRYLQGLDDVARDGTYAILGNHDHYAGADVIAEALRASKIHLLDNESVRIRSGDGGGFALLGVDDIQGRTGWSKNHRGPDLARAAAALPPDLSRILLAHQPRFFLESQGRVDLQLSGHTHGGQINPGFRPARALMEFIAGRYERSGSTLYVNRGFGVTGPPSRIGSAPEITKLVIVAA